MSVRHPEKPSPRIKMVLILFTLSLQYVYELLLFFPEKKIGHPTNPPLENAMPHQLSGCKYKTLLHYNTIFLLKYLTFFYAFS